MDQVFRPTSPSIVSEIIDGEAIIMDMRSGSYYSAESLGADIWAAMQAGAGRQQVVDAVTHQFPEATDAATETAAFLDSLIAADLFTAHDAEGSSAAPAFNATSYKPPVLSSHNDLQDLILLDPIHDVDTMGWPTRKDLTPAFTGGDNKN